MTVEAFFKVVSLLVFSLEAHGCTREPRFIDSRHMAAHGEAAETEKTATFLQLVVFLIYSQLDP